MLNEAEPQKVGSEQVAQRYFGCGTFSSGEKEGCYGDNGASSPTPQPKGMQGDCGRWAVPSAEIMVSALKLQNLG